MKLTPLSTARRSNAIASPSSRGGPQTPGPVIRIAPRPRRPTVGPPLRVSVIGRSMGVVWSGMMRRAPRLPGGRLVVGRRIAIVGRIIAGWVGRGRCGTGRGTRRSPDRDTRPDARAVNRTAVDGPTAIRGAAAVDRTAHGGSAIGTARGGAAVRTANRGGAGGGADGGPAHRTAIGGPTARSCHRSPAKGVRRRR